MKKRITAGGVVVNQDGKILLVQNGRLAWSFPKGGVDEGESMQKAAFREIYEETGIPESELELVAEEILGSFARYKGGPNGTYNTNVFKTVYMFHFKTQFNDELRPLDGDNPQA
jgi:8-oxo-dGTP pyrophosphatase MutT (NUDIX family)